MVGPLGFPCIILYQESIVIQFKGNNEATPIGPYTTEFIPITIESFRVICPNLLIVRAQTDPDLLTQQPETGNYKKMKQIGDIALTATRTLDAE